MDPRRAAEMRLTPDATEFVRFCYRRRAVGWPELYDEMCAVASRGLFRGWGPTELADQGVGFSLFELPALAGLVARVVTEEQAARRAMTPARSAIRIVAGGPEADGEPGPVAHPGRVIQEEPSEATGAVMRPHLVGIAS